MNEQGFLRPTVTQRLRTFLDDEGKKVVAWTTIDQVLDALWATLHARRDDPGFWRRFESLIEDLRVDAARDSAGGLAHPSAELLSGARICDLLHELRGALPSTSGRPEPGSIRRTLPRLSAPLAAVLVLLGGLACKRSATTSTPDTAIQPAPPAPALQSYVDQSTLDAAKKSDLTTCLPGLSPERRDGLVVLFRNAEPAVIARALEAMLEPGGDCAPVAPPQADAGTTAPEASTEAPAEAGTAAPDVAAEPADAADARDETRYIQPIAPVYKGVSWP
jgi:hypothetical protein